MKPEELKIIADMTVRLTEFEKERAVEKLCVSSHALGLFGDLLAAYAKHDRVEISGQADAGSLSRSCKPCPHNNTTPIDEHHGRTVFYKQCNRCKAKCNHDGEWFGWRRI